MKEVLRFVQFTNSKKVFGNTFLACSNLSVPNPINH
jgi:hypothetical protein